MADTEEIIKLFDNLKDFNEKMADAVRILPLQKTLWKSNGTWGSDSS